MLQRTTSPSGPLMLAKRYEPGKSRSAPCPPPRNTPSGDSHGSQHPRSPPGQTRAFVVRKTRIPTGKLSSIARSPWLSARFRVLKADVLPAQEVWDEDACKSTYLGITPRLKVEELQPFPTFPTGFQVAIPGLGVHSRLNARHLWPHYACPWPEAQGIHHTLQSQRPKFVQDAQGHDGPCGIAFVDHARRRGHGHPVSGH